MTTLKRLLLSGALLPLALALPLQCNKDNPGGMDGQDMAGGNPSDDLAGGGGGDGGGGGGGDGGTTTMDLNTPDLLLLGVSPALGPSTGMSGGNPVVLDINGGNFVAGMQVLIGGQSAVVEQVVSSTLMKVRLPAKLGTKGPVAVEVRHPDTRTVSRSDLFRYYYGNVALTLQGTKLDIGTQPWAIAIAELNNNNKQDVIAVNRSSNNLGVALGNGDGTFGAVGNVNTSVMGAARPTGLVLGDMNKDGFLDAIACNEGPSSVSVLLNNQTGVFARNNEYAVGSTPQAVVGADLNADTMFDVLTANAGGNSASLLYGAAGSAFTTPATTLTPGGAAQNPSSLALVDLNKDAKPDVVLVNQLTNNVSVFLWNDTTKAFEWKANYQTGANTGPRGVTVGDFIGDGNVDVAVSLGTATPQILILPGDGTGALLAGTLHPVSANSGDAPLGMASADFDADGVPDIITTLSASNGIALVLNRNKTPQPATFILTGKNPQAVAVGDLNSDGKPDLAVANTGDNQVAILLNTSQ